MIHPEINSPQQFEGGEKSPSVGPYMSGEQITNSIEICKNVSNPVKLTWENLNYEVEIQVNSKDAKN